MHKMFLAMLKEDHKTVKRILGAIRKTKDSAPKKRENLFQMLREELLPYNKRWEVRS